MAPGRVPPQLQAVGRAQVHGEVVHILRAEADIRSVRVQQGQGPGTQLAEVRVGCHFREGEQVPVGQHGRCC